MDELKVLLTQIGEPKNAKRRIGKKCKSCEMRHIDNYWHLLSYIDKKRAMRIELTLPAWKAA
ncbi:MAG: hypothetical protein A2Y10_17365 [Planctomycetes bacterium GWF2_41_51]|nr:MAG: hypothetical protein A2Y10_17365 [Planctomycetes bacterium GWF2_41_51]HBG27996.1 hypothetical protein [Phycisphaerales bacterium]